MHRLKLTQQLIIEVKFSEIRFDDKAELLSADWEHFSEQLPIWTANAVNTR